MNPRLKALLAQKQAYIDEARALENKAEWSAEDEARATELGQLVGACDQAIEEAKEFSSLIKGADTALNGGLITPAAAHQIVGDVVAEKAAKAYRGKVKNFTGSTSAEKSAKAFRFGMWLLATSGNKSAITYCSANGLPVNFQKGDGTAFRAALGQSEGINEDGGYLVPPEFESDLIILREQYGVFRQFARMQPMSSDVSSRPRRTGGLTAYFVGEATAAAASKMGWDRVELNARKAMVLAYTSTELNEDAIISMGDTLAGEIAYAFAKLEDGCGFNGDGTSLYGKMVGLRQRLIDVYGAGGGLGLTLGSGSVGATTNWSELQLADFNNVSGTLPQFADTPNTGWFCHKVFYHTVMERLMLAAGGVTAAEVAQGRRTLIFMGYPVHVSQIMPNQQAVSQVPVLFGDMALSTDFGDRRQTTIMFSEHAAFTTDEIAIRGTERFDINNHDVGSTTQAGPIVGLITAAS